MASILWRRLVELSIIGNAVLFVLLLGGSHPLETSSGYPQIFPHKPVHFARTFDLLTAPRYATAIIDAQQAWDDATGYNIIWNYGTFDDQELDAIFVDLIPNTITDITHNAHNGNSNTFTYLFVCPDPCRLGGVVDTIAAVIDQTGEPFKVGAINVAVVPALVDRDLRRFFTHELGHVLSLGDHDTPEEPEPYAGMMDSTCTQGVGGCEDDPGDYAILNFTLELYPGLPILQLFPDEASCVRKLFEIPGKQLCDTD